MVGVLIELLVEEHEEAHQSQQNADDDHNNGHQKLKVRGKETHATISIAVQLVSLAEEVVFSQGNVVLVPVLLEEIKRLCVDFLN